MDQTRREWLLGTCAVLGFVGAGHGAHRHLRARQAPTVPPAPAPAPEPGPEVPGLDYVIVDSYLELREPNGPLLAVDAAGAVRGHPRSVEAGARSFAFAAELDFARARVLLADQLRPRSEVACAADLEVCRRGQPPRSMAVPVFVDAAPSPCLIDGEDLDCPHPSRVVVEEAMPFPPFETVLLLTSAGLRLSAGEQQRSLPPLLPDADAPLFDAEARYVLANRGAVSRVNRRDPWLFVADDVPWWQVIRVLMALAPGRCQGLDDCGGPWAILHAGPAAPLLASLL